MVACSFIGIGSTELAISLLHQMLEIPDDGLEKIRTDSILLQLPALMRGCDYLLPLGFCQEVLDDEDVGVSVHYLQTPSLRSHLVLYVLAV